MKTDWEYLEEAIKEELGVRYASLEYLLENGYLDKELTEYLLQERVSRALKGQIISKAARTGVGAGAGAVAGGTIGGLQAAGAIGAGTAATAMGAIPLATIPLAFYVGYRIMKSRGNDKPFIATLLGEVGGFLENTSVVKPHHMKVIRSYLKDVLEKEGMSKEMIEKKLDGIRYGEAEKILTRGERFLKDRLKDKKITFKQDIRKAKVEKDGERVRSLKAERKEEVGKAKKDLKQYKALTKY